MYCHVCVNNGDIDSTKFHFSFVAFQTTPPEVLMQLSHNIGCIEYCRVVLYDAEELFSFI